MEAAACLLLLLPHLAPLPAAKFWLLVVNRLGACLLTPPSSLPGAVAFLPWLFKGMWGWRRSLSQEFVFKIWHSRPFGRQKAAATICKLRMNKT